MVNWLSFWLSELEVKEEKYEEGLHWGRVTLKRGTGLAQGGTEKEGGEPMKIISWTRLCLSRLDTSWLKCG